MRSLSLFAANHLRLHPNAITTDGLGIATPPFLSLPLDVSEEELEEAVQQCLQASRSGVPHRPWTKEETKAYYQQLGVRSQKELGRGAQVEEKEGRYTVTTIKVGGLFEAPVEVEEAELLDTIRTCLGLWPAANPR